MANTQLSDWREIETAQPAIPQARFREREECGGLPNGKIEELFQPYEQRSVDRTGLGLGLAMCKWGTEVNGGRIAARNLPHHGCVFTVDLPRSPAVPRVH